MTEEAEATLKDVSDSADPEAAYEFVEDDEELGGSEQNIC